MATTTKAFIRFMSTQGRKNVRDRSKKSSSVPFQSNANVATNNNRRTARERRAYPAGLGTSLNGKFARFGSFHALCAERQ
mmetsp:Transcript_15353/g.23922  ORF Transcript_15353/g.23922 Transcript_15353/m.23922 type:complete len:80 (+) Transcript_15353:156-395(+)